MESALHIVFDGPPSHDGGRFVEVETPDGKSVRAGEWHERADGLWELRLRGTFTVDAVNEVERREIDEISDGRDFTPPYEP